MDKTDETFKVSGDKLVSKIQEIIKEGNARRIIVRDKNDKTLIEFPLSIGVIGTFFAPVLAAIGAMAALITECTITVVRCRENTKKKITKK